MSLFPAYAAETPVKVGTPSGNDKEWLANGSFPLVATDKDTKELLPSKQDLIHEESPPLPVSSSGTDHTSAADKHDAKAGRKSVPSDDRHRKKHKRQRSRSRSRSRSPSSRSRHKPHKKDRKRAVSPAAKPVTAEPPPLRGNFLEDAGVRPEAAFSVDRRPDRAARAFPEMCPHYVARYRRRGGGILGRPPAARRSLGEASRYYERRWRKKLRRVAVDTLPKTTLPTQHSFVPLTAREASPSPPPSSTTGPADPADYLKSVRVEGALAPDAEEISLNRRLATDPTSASQWLELADRRRRRLAGRVTAQQLLESELAVLERALRHCAGSAELQLRRLELRQPDLPPEEARKEWRQLLFSHPADLGLWRRYLASQQHCPGFTVSGLVSAHTRCLQKMRQLQVDACRPHRPPPGLESFMLEVVGHLCRVLREAGYMERAVAVYQALLELNLFSPPAATVAAAGGGSAGRGDAAIAAMEPFWDARLPRVGEPGARGWPTELGSRADRPSTATECAVDDEDIEQTLLAAGGARADLWRALETSRSSRHWLPWDRPGEEDDCEDTDRIVLFDDVRGFLFTVEPQRRGRIVEEFVSFLCGEESEASMEVEDDTLRMMSASAATLVPSQSEVPPLTCGRVDSPASVLTMPPLGPGLDSPEYATFVDRVLEQAAAAVEGEQRTRLLQRRLKVLARRASLLASSASSAASSSSAASTASASASTAKEARKRMKAILKAERHSVPLFIEYASFEASAGALETAARVLLTTLQQCGGDDPVRFDLAHRACLLRAAAGDTDGCRAALCDLFDSHSTLPSASSSSTPSSSSSSSQLARTTSRLRRLLPEMTALVAGGRAPPSLVHVTCCLSWCQLVTAGLEEASDVIEAVIGELERSGSEETDSASARLRLAGCRLLAAAAPLCEPPAWRRRLRAALESGLARRPLDAELTALAVRHCPLSWRERLSATADSAPPLLSLLRASAEISHLYPGSPPPPPPPLEEEAGGDRPSRATVAARLRRRLARMVQQPPLQHWLPLWLVYLELELRTGGKELEAVCYRAVQACPWSKQAQLYLSRRHLRRARDLMSSTGLRLRLPLEELDLLLEDEPEMQEELGEDYPGVREEREKRYEELSGERRGEGREGARKERRSADDGSGTDSDSESDSGTGSESESESDSEPGARAGSEREDSGPGTPSPPPS